MCLIWNTRVLQNIRLQQSMKCQMKMDIGHGISQVTLGGINQNSKGGWRCQIKILPRLHGGGKRKTREGVQAKSKTSVQLQMPQNSNVKIRQIWPWTRSNMLSISYFMLEKLQLAHSGGFKQPFNLTAAVRNILSGVEGSASFCFIF